MIIFFEQFDSLFCFLYLKTSKKGNETLYSVPRNHTHRKRLLSAIQSRGGDAAVGVVNACSG